MPTFTVNADERAEVAVLVRDRAHGATLGDRTWTPDLEYVALVTHGGRRAVLLRTGGWGGFRVYLDDDGRAVAHDVLEGDAARAEFGHLVPPDPPPRLPPLGAPAPTLADIMRKRRGG